MLTWPQDYASQAGLVAGDDCEMGDGDRGRQGQRWRFNPAALEALLSVVTRLARAEEDVPAGGTRQERADARRAAVLAHARDIARIAE